MLQPLAIAVIGGILISMVLSLIVTPAIQFFLTSIACARVRTLGRARPVLVLRSDFGLLTSHFSLLSFEF